MIEVSMSIDENLKAQAESLFEDIGLNMTTAFNLFLKAAVREQRIPFELSRKSSEAFEAQLAIEEFEANYEYNSRFVNKVELQNKLDAILEGE